MRLSLLVLIAALTSSTPTWGAEAPQESASTSLIRGIDMRTEGFQGNIAFGLETSQMTSDTGTNAFGIGPRLGVDWDLGHRLSVSPAVALVSSADGGYLYSGISGFLRYSIKGQLKSIHQIVTSHGTPIVEQDVPRSSRISVGAGLEQIFLNGSQNVYPAAGFSVGANGAFTMFANEFEISLRYSALTTNYRTVNAVIVDFSYLLGL